MPQPARTTLPRSLALVMDHTKITKPITTRAVVLDRLG
jgi:hypothetical protein